MLKTALSAIVILLALAVLSFGPIVPRGTVATVQAQQTQPAAPQMPGMKMPDMNMPMHQMMADVKAADTKLDQLILDVNAAKGDARTPAIALAVTEIAAQLKSMHEHMGTMHDQMMGGRGMMMMPK